MYTSDFMGRTLIYSLAAAGIAFIISSAALPLARRIALAVRAVDYPGGRRDQPEGIPRLGGVAVFLGLFVAQGALAVLQWQYWRNELPHAGILAIPLAFFIIFLCGLLEDVIGISPFARILMQAAAALLIMKVGWSFEVINLPFIGPLKLGILTGVISFIWIVGVTNAINLLDGLDGLAGGVVAIIAASFLVFALIHHDSVAAMMLSALLGACLGFLRRNWTPAQIYLGDSGSLTLGFALAAVSVRSSLKASAAIAILVPILALGLPVIDTLLVMLFRFFRKSRGTLLKRAVRMFRADRYHLHHLMLRVGPARAKIVAAIYALAALFCAAAFLVAASKNATLGFTLVGLEILVVFAMRRRGLQAEAQRVALEKRRIVREALLKQSGIVDLKDSA